MCHEALRLSWRCQVIAELDEKKREALEKTWRKVNQDFGSIFSMLLPGTSAKLEPPEDCSFLDGVAHPLKGFRILGFKHLLI